MRKLVKTLFEHKTMGETLVSVRDYEVDDCIKKNDSMHIVYGNDTMTLTPESLKTKVISKSKLFESKLKGGQNYHLINYIWEPNKYTDD